MNPNIQDKLLVIFADRLLRIWGEKSCSFRAVFSPEDRADIAREWSDYIEGLGGEIQVWGKAVQDQHGCLLIRNPCEESERDQTMTYIRLTENLALKILALGELP